MRGRIRKREQRGLYLLILWFSEDDAVTNTEKLVCIAVVVPTPYRYIYVIRVHRAAAYDSRAERERRVDPSATQADI